MHHAVLIDDDCWALADIRKTFDFERYGFVVDAEYQSAESALPGLLASPPELIISDIRMERMDGLELVRRLRGAGVKARIIIVSGYERFEYAQEALRQGVYDYLLKPLDDEQVQRLMERLCAELVQDGDGSEGDLLTRAMRYIQTHYMVSLPLETVANHLFINKTYLSDLFSKQMGVTFTQYKNGLRIKHAKQMLRQSGRPITEIAYAVGFNSSSRFSKVFQQLEGISPQQYRRQAEPLMVFDEKV